ncbi:hypothetical protein [Enterobacter mori]|uniref:hypothetical protein n=1 Tax=Enterobacter mori TaxID=539813 RepID=UPI001B8CF430|nr:hypothetical protein [Enterobacter mori]MBS3050401.1 hypothetical protein [Enterobacter mori]
MSAPNIDSTVALSTLSVKFPPLLPEIKKSKENEGQQLAVNDIGLDSEMRLPAEKEIPRLSHPRTNPDYASVMGQLNTLELPEMLPTLDDMAIACALTPEGLKGTIRGVLQREIAATTIPEDRVRTEGLINDDQELRYLAAAVQVMLVGSLYNQINTSQQEQVAINDKAESRDNVKELDFIGIQTEEMMQFLLSMLRKIMSEINVAERRIQAMFSELYASSSQLSAEATITEGERLLRGAIISSGIAFGITGATAGAQVRGLRQQSKLVNNELKDSNMMRHNAKELQRNGPDYESKQNQSILRGRDGQDYTPVSMTPEAKAKIDKLHQASIDADEHSANLLGQEYDHNTNKLRTRNSIAEQVGRNSDQAANIANAANMTSVKEAEADRTIQNTAAEVAKSTANDKEKQIDKQQDMSKQIRDILNQTQDNKLRLIQTLTKN